MMVNYPINRPANIQKEYQFGCEIAIRKKTIKTLWFKYNIEMVKLASI
ncbi:hypothetical protein ABEW03_08615 [Virgibacillus pantothenticus]